MDSTVPKCADVCPTEGAIVWDMPYTAEYNAYYLEGQGEGRYKIRVHKKQGIFSPENKPKPFREVITLAQREAHEAISV